jgi:hypothetical protein
MKMVSPPLLDVWQREFPFVEGLHWDIGDPEEIGNDAFEAQCDALTGRFFSMLQQSLDGPAVRDSIVELNRVNPCEIYHVEYDDVAKTTVKMQLSPNTK